MTASNKTVLVVEDKASLTQMLQFLFLSKGLDVEIAYDGVEAMEKVGNLRPNLILLDIMMPKMDGFEVLEKLKESLLSCLLQGRAKRIWIEPENSALLNILRNPSRRLRLLIRSYGI